MLQGRFSRTALGAAGHRAVHQGLEGGRIFADPLALLILGPDGEAALAQARAEPERRGMRLFVAFRSRIAEDAALRAIEQGARQVVVLGAGLDTFAYRLPPREGLRAFEVDHPDTQREKRRRLDAAGIAVPANLSYAACDFERVALADALRSAGFDEAQRTFFLWLGVTPYLTRAAVLATLATIAELRAGAEVVFDYANPPESIEDPQQRRSHEVLASRVAEQHEPFLSYFATDDLHAELGRLGFAEIEDFGPAEMRARLAANATEPAPRNGGHVVRAASPPSAHFF